MWLHITISHEAEFNCCEWKISPLCYIG